PTQADDHKNPLERMMGNGLRPDVWLDFKKRFGVKRIAEFYGASEGNVGFVNVFNKDCTIGVTPVKIALIEYDIDEDEIIRDSAGFCTEVKKGEPGLLLSEITDKTPFEGYTNKEATEKKVVHDVFKKGDAWFNTGDMIKQIDVGFALGQKHYQFVDRVGDTFRWKSENVSTNEVGEILNGYPGVKYCNVFGVDVPGADGKAGMAAMVLDGELDGFNMAEFSAYVKKELPAYACPVFIRIQPDIEVTGTFKMVKGDLRKEAYDIEQVQDPLFILQPRAEQYATLTPELYQQVRQGEGGF
ncbi:MAG: long-chain-acyl-CoA synthetase, partial [Pseudomonadota bacterium]